jgi:hypothetical protein
MAGSVFVDVCRFSPTTGGTTDWTFSSAVTGYQSPSNAGIVNGALYSYRAESADLSQWEMGQGTYNTGTGVLARTTVLYNSSASGTGSGQSGAGTKISFSTTPQVAIVALAEDLLPITSVAPITNSLGADTAISNAAYTDGPSVAQGTVGTWFASGTVTALDTVQQVQVSAKLWDGTTVIASTRQTTTGANLGASISLSGFLATPAGNIRISCTSNGAATTFKFNNSGNSKDCTVSAFRIK